MIAGEMAADNQRRRRRRLAVGIVLFLVAGSLQVALFISPLERRTLTPAAWTTIVTGLHFGAMAWFCAAWAARRDTLGLVALALAALALCWAIGLVLIFIGITALSGLR
jgi:FtsH-binding integral membrane protein